METAVFGGGCFWCTEAIFKRLKGVISVDPGYSGGKIENPSYEQVCSGTTDHAEVIKIVFDPTLISYKLLLEIFFYTHNPTTPNQQGNDIGTQYRSIIFYTTQKQKEESENYILDLEENKIFDRPIVTKVEKFDRFYIAEDYHKNYYDRNKNNLYCDITIKPKIEKLLLKYKKEILKEYIN
jgi:peptide-methionine (S)-S-oxide reductase